MPLYTPWVYASLHTLVYPPCCPVHTRHAARYTPTMPGTHLRARYTPESPVYTRECLSRWFIPGCVSHGVLYPGVCLSPVYSPGVCLSPVYSPGWYLSVLLFPGWYLSVLLFPGCEKRRAMGPGAGRGGRRRRSEG